MTTNTLGSMQASASSYDTATSSSDSSSSEASVSAGGGAWGVSVSASYSTSSSASFESAGQTSNSEAMMQDKLQSSEGSVDKFQSIATASLFQFAINHQEVELSSDVVSSLAALQTDEDVFNYIKWYGTHLIQQAEMGARYEKQTYSSASASYTSLDSYREASYSDAFSNATAYAFSSSASVSVDSAWVSASASVSSESASASTSATSTSTDASESTTSESSVSTSNGFSWVKISGMVDASGTECGDLVGEVDRLLPIKYHLKPLWEVFDYPGVEKVEAFYNKYLSTAV